MLPFDFLTPKKKLISVLLVSEMSCIVEPSGNEGQGCDGKVYKKEKGQSERRSDRTSRWIA